MKLSNARTNFRVKALHIVCLRAFDFDNDEQYNVSNRIGARGKSKLFHPFTGWCDFLWFVFSFLRGEPLSSPPFASSSFRDACTTPRPQYRSTFPPAYSQSTAPPHVVLHRRQSSSACGASNRSVPPPDSSPSPRKERWKDTGGTERALQK